MDNLSKILIVPLGGNDYNSPTPRFLNPCGDSSMLHQSLDDIEKFNFDMILIILFNNPHLEQQINRINYLNEKNHDFKIVSIEPTNSPAETVYMGLKTLFNPALPHKFSWKTNHYKITKQPEIYIKDFDEKVDINPKNLHPNTVYNWSLNKGNITDVEKKSYIRTNPNNTILNIVEKDVISSQFSVGFYSFKKITDFTTAFEHIREKGITNNIYISHIIYQLILSGQQFQTIEVDDYIDWGNDILWMNYLKTFLPLKRVGDSSYLHIYGCSHSGYTVPPWAQEKHEPKVNQFWGNHLANSLNISSDCVRINSFPGCSINQIKQKITFDIIHDNIQKEDVIIISPSYSERFGSNIFQYKKKDSPSNLDSVCHWNFERMHGFVNIIEGDANQDPQKQINRFSELNPTLEVDLNIIFSEWFYTTIGMFIMLRKIYPNTFLWFLEDVDFINLHISKIMNNYVGFNSFLGEYKLDGAWDYKKVLKDENIIKCKTHDSWDTFIRENCWEHPSDDRKNDGHLGIEGHSKFSSYLYEQINPKIK